MKKYLLLFIIMLASATSLKAVRAYSQPGEVVQPDGSHLMVQLHGDEFLNYSTTLDGYTVVLSESTNAWEYADMQGDLLISSGIIAHNSDARTAVEKQFLKYIAKGIVPTPSPEQQEMKKAASKMRSSGPARILGDKKFDYDKFRGLVILVEYSDRAFTRTDAFDIFNDMVNKPNFTGFTNTSGTAVNYTGSVYDYFNDNSGGKFKPTFDVFGPVKIDKTSTSPRGTSAVYSVIQAAITAADPLVDFSKYDTDGDGIVDMIYFIFAGAGSNFSGNNSNFIWPHASSTYGIRDGVQLGRYACSTELYGYLSSKTIDGIGTIVHEFSHVLGVADLYDTDYEGSGGQSFEPGDWSVMAGGSYANSARTPVAYSAYERYANGFDTPETISEPGSYTLPYLGNSGKSYKLDSPIANEYYIFENRQKTKWDAYLPGNGMLVFRVDSTSNVPWLYNTVNADPKHNYYEMLRAFPQTTVSGAYASSGDPFPGSYRVKKISSFFTWNGTPMPYTVSQITEVTGSSSVKNVTFTLGDNKNILFESFDAMPIIKTDSAEIEGKFTKWDIFKGAVTTPYDACGYGKRSVGLYKAGSLTTAPIDTVLSNLAFELSLPSDYTPTKCVIKVWMKTKDSEWSLLKTSEKEDSVSVKRGAYTRLSYPIDNVKGASFKFELPVGSVSEYAYIDNMLLNFGDETSAVKEIQAFATEYKLNVRNIGGRIVVNGAEPNDRISLYSIDGRLIDQTNTDDSGYATLVSSRKGVFIIATSTSTFRIIL